MKTNSETLDFIRKHLDCNTSELRLRYAGKEVGNVDIAVALTQIEGRQKAYTKLSPWLEKHLDFMFADTLSAEQCTAWQVAAYHAKVAGELDAVLDLTCGLGVDAMYMSQRAHSLVACDISEANVQCANANAALLGFNNFKAVCLDASDYLSKLPAEANFSLIFADPARRGQYNRRTYALEDCSPDILKLLPLIKAHTGKLMVKVSPMLDVVRVFEQMPEITAVHAVSLKGECKELLLECDFNKPSEWVHCYAVDIANSGQIHGCDFCILKRMTGGSLNLQSVDIKVNLIESVDRLQAGLFLFEPNASLMKFINYAPLSSLHNPMYKLGANTHLWVSETPFPSGMPGRVTKIKDVYNSSRKSYTQLPPHINIVSRNYPDTVETVKKRLRVKDGGDDFLYCCLVLDRYPRLLHCVRVVKETV